MISVSAGWTGTSVALLVYGALFVPIQLSFWDKDTGRCIAVPTLPFDMFVDVFFCVSLLCSGPGDVGCALAFAGVRVFVRLSVSEECCVHAARGRLPR